MGYGGMAAVLVAMLAALTVLPATLRLLGRRVDAGRLPWRRHRPVAVEDAHGRWAALARGVMRRPWLVIVGTVAVLLLIASPFLDATWGSVDYRVLPADAPAHVAAEKLHGVRPRDLDRASLLLRGASEAEVAAYAEQVLGGRRRRRRPAGRHRGRRHPAAGLVGGQQPDRGIARTSSRRSARSTRRPGRSLVGGLSARHRRPASTRSARTCPGWA